ncbi:hypothetical protein C8R43DRAFT_516320 [Mycena crocata]|nr:hypothetical protein C8R43DRAFT_516320 [Mycena crocata]
MSASYTILPTQAPTENGNTHTNGYPPNNTKALLARLTPAAPPTRIRRLLLFLSALALSSTLLVYLVFSSSFSSFSGSVVPPYPGGDGDYAYTAAGDSASPFFRDTHPVLHARLFLARAQAEIRARGLDTCNGQLGTRMVDGYLDAALPYCEPASNAVDASITCFPVRAPPNDWWPYTQAFCGSRNLAHTPGWGGDLSGRGMFTGQCRVTDAGKQLKADMGREMFLGVEFQEADAQEKQCGEMVKHPVLFVPRQDRWNPFHVGEDLVTTFLALTLFSRHAAASESSSWSSSASKAIWSGLATAYIKYASSPTTEAHDDSFAQFAAQLETELRGTAGLQLVFQDEYLPTQSLFAPLYDRIGAWAPRRTAAEALGEGGAPTCFATAFHSVGAGASLLSATGVGKEYKCASELVWGAGLWLRWTWGLEPLPGGVGLGGGANLVRRGESLARGNGSIEVERRAPVTKDQQQQQGKRPIQVLFLSREKFDAFTRHKNKKLTPWQEARHIANERALVTGLRTGLAGLCRVVTPSSDTSSHSAGEHDCTYTDADAVPGAWGVRMHAREAHALGLDKAPADSPSHDDAAKTADAGIDDSHAHQAPRRSVSRPRGNSTASGDFDDDDAHARRASGSTARALRFATLDPTTSALAAQLGTVGRADVVVGVHAGALGLTLFMPTGRASVVELVTTGAAGVSFFLAFFHSSWMQYFVGWHALP